MRIAPFGAALVTLAFALVVGAGCVPPPEPMTLEEQRLQTRLVQLLPDDWKYMVPRVEIIQGDISYAHPTHIEIGEWVLRGDSRVLDSTLAHEWGHYEALQRNRLLYNGNPPAGFPFTPKPPTFPPISPNWNFESWAVCVAVILTGEEIAFRWGEHPYPLCTDRQQQFTSQYLLG